MLPQPTNKSARGRWALAIHGGAGVISQKGLRKSQEIAYRAALTAAIGVGEAVLDRNGSALDAVEVCVRNLENNPLFNAGYGAVFTADGRNELDASIMDGRTLKAGAVAGVTKIKNPVSLARAVMGSDHVMLIGAGAEAFGRARYCEQVEAGYFATETRWSSLRKFLLQKGWPLPVKPNCTKDTQADLAHDEGKWGTVGAVALDRAGHVAAATSTGGLTGKQFGRVGDSPLIGAGCYANDQSCAVSCTGEGEYFIRLAVAHSISERMRLQGLELQRAVDVVVQHELTELGGKGGVIALTVDGQLAYSFNTEGMYRAKSVEGGCFEVALYRNEILHLREPALEAT